MKHDKYTNLHFGRGNITNKRLPEKRKYPDVNVKKINGSYEINIDKNNLFTYADANLKAAVRAEFKKRFSGRLKENESIEKLEQEIETFLQKCVKKKMIMRKDDLDDLYKGHCTPGGPGYYSNSYVKCF